MQKQRLYWIAVFIAMFSAATYAESLAQYVNDCKSQLNISSIPALDCRDGVNFQPAGDGHDYVISARVTDDVDATFACRWVKPNGMAFAAEMLVHSRKSGSTCFFEAIKGTSGVSPRNISPTDTNASNYWVLPNDIQGDAICVNCHVAGAYIASKNIAFALGYYGLLNNGHDTKVDRYHVVGGSTDGGRAAEWNDIIANNIYDAVATPVVACANGCHVLGGKLHPNKITGDVAGSPVPFDVMVSINTVISEIRNNQLMGPPITMDYRWVNMDTPNATGDYETLEKLKTNYEKLWCSNPTDVEAHVVGSNHIISTRDQSNFPNVLRTFNLKEGLRCVQSDQAAGTQCKDYSVSYRCGDGSSTVLMSRSARTSNGDSELRANIPDLCAGKGEPISMIAGYDLGARSPGFLYAPNDKLAQFNSNGLVCKKADQPDGKCSNYVVRFTCP